MVHVVYALGAVLALVTLLPFGICVTGQTPTQLRCGAETQRRVGWGVVCGFLVGTGFLCFFLASGVVSATICFGITACNPLISLA